MIPLFSPLRQNEPLTPEMEAAFHQVLASGQYILGETVKKFETELAAKIGYHYAIGCASGTDAITLSLKALKLPADSEVITPAFSFIASCTCIQWAGFMPVLADVDPETANLSLETVERSLTPKTRAIIAVDLYGRQAPIADLRQLCNEKGIFLIEDGAQSIGVPPRGAHLFTTSFYPTKNLAALGDGGAILTDCAEMADLLNHLGQHGAWNRDDYRHFGTNSRLDALHAAMLSVKLKRLEQWNEKRQTCAEYYLKELAPLAEKHGFFLPPDGKQPNAWSLFTLRFPKARNEIREALTKRGVSSGIYYSKSLNHQPIFQSLNAHCPNAERLANEVLSIPLFPELTDPERQTVVTQLQQCMRQLST